ncbi:MAG: hypothetical protein AB1512_10675 [Thermodesulfobacteriota bacterium]
MVSPRSILIRSVFPLLAVPGLLLLGLPPASCEERTPYQQVAGLIDLRTTFSDGTHSIEELVRIARSRGFRLLFLNDHDRVALSYGLPPFRNLLRYRKTFPSIMSHGPEKYLSEVDRVSRLNPGMLIIPGCETSPFYYWTGSWLAGDLTAHEYDRRLLLISLETPEDYRSLPVAGNDFSFRYWKEGLPPLLFFLPPLWIALVFLRRRGVRRGMGVILLVLTVAAVLDAHPFRGSPFNPYRGAQGILPYQTVIDYANERGALAFWNYPEQRSGVRDLGPIRMNTPPYPQVLYQSKGYTGFAAIYGDRMSHIEPGKEWDRALNEYCRGDRENPPWGISTADFHEDGRLGLGLGDFPTVFLVRNFAKGDILDAMRRGRMYCARGSGSDWPRLEIFQVGAGHGTDAVMGETVVTDSHPIIRFRVSHPSGKEPALRILLIRGGRLIRTFEGSPPFEVTYEDNEAPPGVTTYYRLLDEKKHLASNPIFVRYVPEAGARVSP